MMAPTAAYDEIADWYEQEFLPRTAAAGADPVGVGAALDALLGRGRGICLEIGCGTGVHAKRVRGLGWTPSGLDLSAAMLRHARGRLPAVRADAVRLPVAALMTRTCRSRTSSRTWVPAWVRPTPMW
jgi:predicted TPR repeat methyltransferase